MGIFSKLAERLTAATMYCGMCKMTTPIGPGLTCGRCGR